MIDTNYLLQFIVFVTHIVSLIPTVQVFWLFYKDRSDIKSNGVLVVNSRILLLLGAIIFYQLTLSMTYGYTVFFGRIQSEIISTVTFVRGFALLAAVVLLKQILLKLKD